MSAPCHEFIRAGVCRRGPSCRFEHSEPAAEVFEPLERQDGPAEPRGRRARRRRRRAATGEPLVAQTLHVAHGMVAEVQRHSEALREIGERFNDKTIQAKAAEFGVELKWIAGQAEAFLESVRQARTRLGADPKNNVRQESEFSGLRAALGLPPAPEPGPAPKNNVRQGSEFSGFGPLSGFPPAPGPGPAPAGAPERARTTEG